MKRTLKRVEDIHLTKKMRVNDIIIQMTRAGGFMGRRLAEAVDIMEEIVSDKDCHTFLSFPAAPVATGLRGVIRDFVKRKLVDAIVTASGTLDHDLARSWANYYHGDFDLNDAALYRRGYHRLGNILVPGESYGPLLEKKLQPFLESLYSEGIREIASSELCEKLGGFVDSDSSILYWAAKNQVPIFVPGLTDGAVGSQLWLFSQRHRDFKIDVLKDEQRLSDIVFTAKKTGAIMIGNGITKHHTLWWNQFRGGLDLAVYITTASEYDGSLTGAHVREAVSWGKVKTKARHVTVVGDATALLPFMVAGLLERIGGT